MTDFSPREIVSELDRFIIGQGDAKRAVAIALRNRWRRMQLDEQLREEVLPKNILMIGPTGVGKTEISRRLARLAGAPFLKVEATKFTEVGYVGRDVEQIVRDLVEIAITQTRERKRKDVEAKAQLAAEERVLDALVGPAASPATKEVVPPQAAQRRARTTRRSRSRCRPPAAACRCSRSPACRARRWARSRSATSSARWAAGAPRRAALTVKECLRVLIAEESDKLLDQEQLVQEAITRGRAERHRVPRRDRQDRRRARAASAPTCRARACSAICCR